LQKIFGRDIFTNDFVDRNKLAEIVFNNKESLDKLNSIIHPRVREDLARWLERRKDHPYVVQEAAILFESGFYKSFDKIVVVSCPEEIAIERVIKRDKLNESDIRSRIQNQWPESKKVSRADFIIHNDGATLVIPQVLKIHEQLHLIDQGKPQPH